MKNLFESDNYPDREPQELAAGTRWAWKRSDITETYPTATYTLRYDFYLISDVETRFQITASKVSSAHLVEVVKATTTKFKAGKYKYDVTIIRDSDSEEIVIEQGLLNVLPDKSVDSGDIRTHNQRVLDAINATIEKTATKEQASYSVAGRSLSRRSITELLELKREYEIKVRLEEKALLRKQGRAKKNAVLYKLPGG